MKALIAHLLLGDILVDPNKKGITLLLFLTYLKDALDVLSLRIVTLSTLFNTMRITDKLQQGLCLLV